jgi:uncharacterized protein (DUF58 family)
MAKENQKSRIFILPTAFGALYLTGALAMIFIGSAYQNNLVNMLAYFMLSLVFVAMIQTHNNLKNISVPGLICEGGFSGREFLVTTVIANRGNNPRFNIESRLRKMKPVSVYESPSTLAEASTIRIRAAYRAAKRGRYQMHSIRVSSIFPLGLFEAWMWLKVSSDYFVYPEPKGSHLPLAHSPLEQAQHLPLLGGSDFHQHRRFQNGDSQHHIDWKAVARGRPKLIKEFTDGATPQSTTFDWQDLDGVPPEERLSQLAQWIEEARSRKISFSLCLPQLTIPAGNDLEHTTRCLEALADFDERRINAPAG